MQRWKSGPAGACVGAQAGASASTQSLATNAAITARRPRLLPCSSSTLVACSAHEAHCSPLRNGPGHIAAISALISDLVSELVNGASLGPGSALPQPKAVITAIPNKNGARTLPPPAVRRRRTGIASTTALQTNGMVSPRWVTADDL